MTNEKNLCICVECVDRYSRAPDKTAIAGDSFENTSSKVTNKILDSIDSNKTLDKTKNEADYDESIEEEICEEIFAKYKKMLDYSLDSLAARIKQVVFGQDEAVRKVIYSIYLNQYVNLLEELDISFDHLVSGGSPGFKRRHILLIGDTGVGKTLLATTAPKVFDIPYSVSNVTPITASGYVGEDVVQILERLYNAAGCNIYKAQQGILILDEIDKKKHELSSNGKDVNGKAVQQELLKLLEPSTIYISKGTIPFDTANLTIIMMGAFVGLDEIIKKRTNSSKIGFSDNKTSSLGLDEVLPEDLIEYGFIPEFVGRIPCVCKLNKLTIDVATNIIYSTLEKYDIIFKSKSFEFIFNPLLVTKVAEKVVASSMGARNIETELDKIIQPALWEVLQSIGGGVCEIKEDGSAEILRNKTAKKQDVEIVTTPLIQDYALTEEDF